MRLPSWLLALVGLQLGCAQTPPGYWPKTHRGLDIRYNSSLLVRAGQSVYPDDCIEPPVFGRPGLNPLQTYLAVMMDVEVNIQGIGAPLVHWIQADLKVDDPVTGQLCRMTEEDVPYVGPRPVAGPRHTYVLLLFKQPANYRFPECYYSLRPISIEARAGFSVEQFIDVMGLQPPVGASYFTAQSLEKPKEPPPRVTTTSTSKAPCATLTGAACA